jgi:hypothetical protein
MDRTEEAPVYAAILSPTCEGAAGLFRAHTAERFGEPDIHAMTRGLGQRWMLDEVAIKPFPTRGPDLSRLHCFTLIAFP